MKKQTKKYPEGHFMAMWIGICMVIFTGFGILFGIFSNNLGLIGIWPGMGLVIGLVIGQALEEKYKKEGKIRPMTKEEEKKKKIAVIIGVVVLLILALLAVMFFISSK